MGSPFSFADLLADKLGPEGPPLWSESSDSCRTRPFEPSVFTRFAGHEGGFRLAYGKAFRSPRRSTTLTKAQRDALGVMRVLGARIEDSFDATELKSWFRRLALALHPDRHPGANTETRARLGSRFSQLCDAYRTLQCTERRCV